MKPIIPIISFLLLALVGCGTNTLNVTGTHVTGTKTTPDRFELYFDAMKPLATTPVVEYAVKKNKEGENDLILTVLRKAVKDPKSGVRRAEVTMIDDRRFAASMSYKLDVVPTNFIVNGKSAPFKIGSVLPPDDNQVIEEEEMEEQTES